MRGKLSTLVERKEKARKMAQKYKNNRGMVIKNKKFNNVVLYERYDDQLW